MLNLFTLFFAVIGFAVTAVVGTALAVKASGAKNKLRILRYGAILIATVGIIFNIRGLRYPLIWLRHYLLGSGRAMRVPKYLLMDAKSALVRAVVYGDTFSSNRFGKYHCLDHSTLYEGSGFYNRPLLFYLMGGFTFLLRRDGKVSGKDTYDWHPTDDGKYFTSPIGMPLLVAVLDWIFGNEWFVNHGFSCGESGISNKLWADLELVGARPFQSYFCNESVFSDTDLMQMTLGTVFTKYIPISRLHLCTMIQQGIEIEEDVIALAENEYGNIIGISRAQDGFTISEVRIPRKYTIDWSDTK